MEQTIGITDNLLIHIELFVQNRETIDQIQCSTIVSLIPKSTKQEDAFV